MSLWWHDRDECSQTDFPSPLDHNGQSEGHFADGSYARQLTLKEEQILDEQEGDGFTFHPCL